jgi:ParB family chromosome partitioning protein
MEKMRLEYIPLNKIEISSSNVRHSNPEENIDELAASIKEIGVQQPVVVFQKNNKYELIIGQRRYLACKKLELEEIPALITTVKDETEATIKSFAENIHRLELNYRDKMQVAIELLKRFRGSYNEVARHLGVTEQTVRNYVGYEAVPDTIKKMVDEGKLGAITAMRIVRKITDEKKAVEIAKKIEEENRSEKRLIIIEIAEQNLDKTAEEITKLVRKAKELIPITLNLTPRIAKGLDIASDQFKSGKAEIAIMALEEWLLKRDFIE